MKVLWLSNCEISTKPTKATGTWLQTMYLGLLRHGVELYNITTSNNVNQVTYEEEDGIRQWLVPGVKITDGVPASKLVQEICSVIDNISPDLVHIWGVERFWGLLNARGHINYPTLLEIQGLRYTCADAYYGGMSIRDIVSSIRLIDLVVTHRRIDRQKASHQAWGKFEKEMLSHHKYISTQSDWVRASIKPYCQAGVNILKTKMAVRQTFMESKSWQPLKKEDGIQLLSIASMATPYKGVHIVLRALALLKKQYPRVILKVVGNYMQHRRDIYKTGYVKFIERLIKCLNLSENVVFTGPLSEIELRAEMQKSHVVVHSSFVESYSLALAESMAIGVPCVISYAGAMCELAENGVSGLYYSPSDYHQCANLITRLIEDQNIAKNISNNARQLALKRNNINDVIATQVEIYNQVLKSIELS